LCEIQTKVDQSETNIGYSKVILGLRKDYKDSKLNDKNPLDKKIIHYLKQSELAPVELNILTNLSEQRYFLQEWQDEKDTLYPEYLKGNKEPATNIIKEISSTSLKTKTNKGLNFDVHC
jgi:hypothetical protein